MNWFKNLRIPSSVANGTSDNHPYSLNWGVRIPIPYGMCAIKANNNILNKYFSVIYDETTGMVSYLDIDGDGKKDN